jgi:hypothetical protein
LIAKNTNPLWKKILHWLLHSSFGFQDTPSFIIVNSKDGSNPEILKGAHPFPSFKTIIDKKITEVENSS